jgi:hypothetical protein
VLINAWRHEYNTIDMIGVDITVMFCAILNIYKTGKKKESNTKLSIKAPISLDKSLMIISYFSVLV